VRKKRNTGGSTAELSNEHAVVLAVAKLGGQFRPIDTEDVAVTVTKIAPGRFMWRKYPTYINIELVHTALRDAKRLGGLLLGSGSSGWQLTTEGIAVAAGLSERGVVEATHRQRLDPKEKAWMARERSRLLSEQAFMKFQEQGVDNVTAREAEHFFRLDDYIVGTARQQRLQRILNFFGADPELGDAIHALSKKVAIDESNHIKQ
jgi:hypothetical protein